MSPPPPTTIVAPRSVDAPLAIVPTAPARIASIDCLRGVVMLFMALDHTRGFLSDARYAPVDLDHTTVALFLTRWITHFCAPTFFLLAGLGAALSRRRSLPDVSRFLLIRGLWLVALELTVVAVGWDFTLYVIPWTAGVLWALGWSMVVMAALVWLPRRAIIGIGIALIALHNATDAAEPKSFGMLSWLWRMLHSPDLHADTVVRIDYPLIPWIGVMAIGYGMAPLLRRPPAERRRVLVTLGVACLVGFLVVRLWNGYGDPQPWSVQRSGVFTMLSFLRVRKYPPSLAYLLMTLGPAFIALAMLERARGRVADVIAIYGKVPLLFYVLHIYLAHAVAGAVAYRQGGTTAFLRSNAGATPVYPDWYGLSLPQVYLVWILVIVTLYPVCRRFAALKAHRRDWWLSYL